MVAEFQSSLRWLLIQQLKMMLWYILMYVF